MTEQDRYGPEEPEWAAVLARKPVRVNDSVSDVILEKELEERLAAVLASRGLAANPEGWRDLAIELLIANVPEGKAAPIPIIADVDLIQGGRDGAGLTNFIWRSLLKQAKKTNGLKSTAAAAKHVAKTVPRAPSARRLENLSARNAPDVWPRSDARLAVEWRVRRLLAKAAQKLESITN